MKKVTIKDIAEEAGVSKATVSRVLNHGEQVDAETKNRVLAIMKKHRYSPSLVARNLSNQGSNTIGIIIPEIDNPFYGKILRTIINLADDYNLIPLCFDTGNQGEKDIKALSVLRDQRVGGVIYAPSVEYGSKALEKKAKQMLSDMAVPAVLIDRDVQSFKCPGIFFDNIDAAYRCTKILIEAGHRKIGVLGGSEAIGIGRDRINGYLKALEEYGIPVRAQYMYGGDFTAETAYTITRGMLASGDVPTAVFTCNNTSALGFMQAMAEQGLKIPADVEHIGIDELDTLDYLKIRYNHVTRSRTQMGAKAVEMLATLMREPEKQVHSIQIEPYFVLDERLEEIAIRTGIMKPEEKGETP